MQGMEQQKPKVASARKLRAMKRASQKRDRDLIANGGNDRAVFLIDPDDAERSHVEFPDADLGTPSRRDNRQDSGHPRLDARSLALHSLIARKLRADPALIKKARATLRRWRSKVPTPFPVYFGEWQRILKGTTEDIAGFLTSTSEDATRLRQSSPFTSILTPEERRRIYEAFLKPASAYPPDDGLLTDSQRKQIRAASTRPKPKKLRSSLFKRKGSKPFMLTLQYGAMETVIIDVRSLEDSASNFAMVWRSGKPEKAARISFATPELIREVLTAIYEAFCVDGHRAAYVAQFEREHGPVDSRLADRLEEIFGPFARLQGKPWKKGRILKALRRSELVGAQLKLRRYRTPRRKGEG
jgi:hypothetical protein